MNQSVIQQTYELAVRHHKAGRLDEAERLYQQILKERPQHVEAMHYLGVLAAQKGRSDLAVDLIRRAISLRPDFAEAWFNLGKILSDRDQTDEAIAAYQQSVALDPHRAETYNNLGVALRTKRRFDEAFAAFQKAIELKPQYARAFCNLGNLLKDKSRYAESVAACQQAIAIDPSLAEAHSNLGIALKGLGRLDEAIASYRRAIAINPNLPQAHSDLGSALIDKGLIDEAIASCRAAIAIDPKTAEAWNYLGVALLSIGRREDAAAAFRQSIAARAGYCDGHSNLLLLMNYHSDYDARTVADEHRRWNLLYAQPLAKFISAHRNDRTPDRRLRIGYMSPDFRHHVVMNFLLPLLKNHDRRQFEIFAYSNVTRPDDMTAQVRSLVNQWREILPLENEQIADQILADGIDILIDLAGHTDHNRLLVLARKPAPVQVTWLGYPNTTGLSAVNYRLTDGLADPPGMTDPYYSEKLIRLPRTNWCFEEQTNSPEVKPPPAIKNGYMTFGSFNNLTKVSEPMIQIWAKILHEVAGSRLLLKSHVFAGPGARERIHRAFAAEGIGEDRLMLRAWEPDHSSHLAAHNQMDIALDTYPYNGTSTTCDALWMGVPVVTLAGQTHVSRVGLSLLTNAGLPELVASTPEQYLRIAINLAADVSRLETLRREMRTRLLASPLMDGRQFARDVEAAYRKMWHAWCAWS